MRYIFRNAHFATFCVVYLDDICVFSTSMNEHVEHPRAVLSALSSAELYANLPKCSWAQETITLLGHWISNLTITLDPAKTEAMKTIEASSNTHELQRFVDIIGDFYRPAFERVQELLQCSPVLQLPDSTQQFLLRLMLQILRQVYSSGEHPVAYLSRKRSDNECQLFAVKFCLEKWRPYLLGAKFTVYTDSIACKWFFTKKKPSPKPLRWFDTFSHCTFDVFYRADALSRPVSVNALLVAGPEPAVAERIKALYASDADCVTILQRLQPSAQPDDRYSIAAGLIVVRDGRGKRVLLPHDDRLQLEVLLQYHDEATVAHPGIVRTYLAVQ
ncbi:Pol Polyprotein [Phytophthora megakarya]|uniref:Pol Polyprotein n=1 Tax=Phytophthora megakarya TaxID=4795 RepID=A0A225WLK2_9STRA|nr:Pol Polyprotein [Phytophthora megakarya]